jgi:hypothetical protein
MALFCWLALGRLRTSRRLMIFPKTYASFYGYSNAFLFECGRHAASLTLLMLKSKVRFTGRFF